MDTAGRGSKTNIAFAWSDRDGLVLAVDAGGAVAEPHVAVFELLYSS